MKALASKLGVPEAVKIWKKLKVHERIFTDPKTLTEQELSILTWRGCDTEKDYKDRRCTWRYLNNYVLLQFELDHNGDYVLDRFYDRVTPTSTKHLRICKPDLIRVRNKIELNINHGAGNLGNAILKNNIGEAGVNVQADFADAFKDKLEDRGFDKLQVSNELQKLFVEAAKKEAYVMGLTGVTRKEIRFEYHNDLLTVLDGKPVIEHKDKEMDVISNGHDGLANSAKKRKKKVEDDERREHK